MDYPAHDLKQQYDSIRDEIDEAIDDVVENTDFILGDAVEQFEKNFAEYCGTDECVGVSSGTSALKLIFKALDLDRGDEVITTPFTFIATAEPLYNMGIKPVFADINPRTYNLDPEQIEDKITENTKAIVTVHLYGQPTEFDAIQDIANRHDLHLIEDAAQAHGARWKGERTGGLGKIAGFSFYPGKNLGAFGDAGGITTSNSSLASDIRGLRDHGRTDKYAHGKAGFNARMDGIQGAVLDVKLNHLDEWNQKRRENAKFYSGALEDFPVKTPTVEPDATHVFHQYSIRLENRDQVKEQLNEKGIGAGIHYPKPLHLQPSLSELSYEKGDFPEAERAANEVLSLPVHSMLDENDLRKIVDALDQAIESVNENSNAVQSIQ